MATRSNACGMCVDAQVCHCGFFACRNRGKPLVNLKKQNGPNSVVVLTVRAASKELMIMRNCDHNAIIVRDLSKVVKFVLTLSLLLASMSAF